MRTNLLLLFAVSVSLAVADDHTRYVNPFIGTQTDSTGAMSGSTFPGACVPFGLVQLSPDTEYNVTDDPCSGYDYDKDTIYAITHTHLSGTGCTDLLDLSIMPSVKDLTPDILSRHDFAQTFSHTAEEARAGYYRVDFEESGIRAELTATAHCGIHRYTFPAGARQNIIVDLGNTIYNGPDAYYIVEGQRSYDVIKCRLRIVNDSTVEGYRAVTGWAQLRKFYFHIEFSKPIIHYLLTDGDRSVGAGDVVNGKLLRAALQFDSDDEPLVVKVALSAVDSDGARANFAAEAGEKDFDSIRQAAHDAWQTQLAMIDIDGTDTEKSIFYTALYHTMIQPNILSDVDGRYVNTNYEVRRLDSGSNYYSTFSLWDTFRAAHPLYNLLCPDLTADLVNSMLIHCRDYGYLPVWDLWGQDNYCMIGNHAVPVLARAVLTGIKGIDPDEAYEAMKTSVSVSHTNFPADVWEKYGYMPEDLQSQSVSLTLEQAFDDWCVAAVAEKLGRTEDAEKFMRRSENYRNLFDSSIGFFAPKDSQGKWLRPFDPLAYGSNGDYPFTEGNAWQYLWFVPHNPDGLIALLGGEDSFLRKLDENFTLTAQSGQGNENASGFIGQYAHGNEPSHHTAYLYNFTRKAWRTQELVDEIRRKFYTDRPSGYAGNDDCGQMSAWYVFSALGFYPFNAGSDSFLTGTPLFNEAVLHLPEGKTFTIKAQRKSKDAIYVKSLKLNGKEHSRSITQSEILTGGTLEFVMTNKRPREY